MWLFMSDSFLSVVEHKTKPGTLLVRSRVKGDIERAVPCAIVWEDPEADYRYRAEVSKDAFRAALSDAVDRITYPNFKKSVKENRRHSAYMRVWQAMAQAYGAFGSDPGPDHG